MSTSAVGGWRKQNRRSLLVLLQSDSVCSQCLDGCTRFQRLLSLWVDRLVRSDDMDDWRNQRTSAPSLSTYCRTTDVIAAASLRQPPARFNNSLVMRRLPVSKYRDTISGHYERFCCRSTCNCSVSNLYFGHSRSAKYCDQGVCVSVCLSVRSHISKSTCTSFTKFSVHVTCGRSSFLLWRQCNSNVMYFRFVDNVVFT